MSWQRAYLNRFYGRDQGWVDGTTEFFALCREWIPPGGRILEVGPGPTNRVSEFLASLGVLDGVDLDEDAASNGSLKSFYLMSGQELPLPSETYDAVVSNYVCEHVERPDVHLREVARVLKPGGVYLLRTPNAYHYVALVSRFTPHWFHRLVANRLRNHKPGHHDPYPTFYAMNTVEALQRLAAAAGLRPVAMHLVEKEPSYGLSSRVLFVTFMAYERLVNMTERASFLRSNIFAVLEKS